MSTLEKSRISPQAAGTVTLLRLLDHQSSPAVDALRGAALAWIHRWPGRVALGRVILIVGAVGML